MHKSDEGSGTRESTSFYIRLGGSGLLDERMHMKRITEGNQHIKYNHIVAVAGKPEREQHKCIYGDTVRRQSNRHVSDRASLIIDIALSLPHHEFTDLGKEKHSHKGVGQFVREFHKPVQVVLHSGNEHRNEEQAVGGETHGQAYIITLMCPIPSYSDKDVNEILCQGGNHHQEKQHGQQPENSGRETIC